MTPVPPPPPCRCGGPRDPRGLCTEHCDAPVTCRLGCPRCKTRDALCVVCGAPCGAPVAARYHEDACRALEQSRQA